MMMHRLAIYDMDKTITRKATYGLFIAHVIRMYRPWRVVLVPLMAFAALGYALRLIDRSQLKEWNLALLLGNRINRDSANRVADSFAAETIQSNVLAGALAQIAADKAAGYQVVIATASFRLYAQAIADSLGLSDVIATELIAVDANTWQPRINGSNCYDAAKLDHVRRWMAQEGLERADCHIRFYSDHVSDAVCLQFADEAFATNAHAPLRELARKRGWKVLDWK